MSRPSSARTCSITTTCCSTGRRWWPSRRSPAEIGGRFDHVLVDEYQDTNRLQASILLALKPDGRGLTVVGDDAQSIYSFRAATVRNILDFPGQFTPAGRDRHARPQLPLDPADPRRRQCRDRSRRRSASPRTCGPTERRRADRSWSPCATRPIRPATSSSGCWRTARPARALKAAGGAVSHLHPQRPARNRADPPQHPVRQVRRPEVPRRRARQGHAGAAALRRESARPRRRLPRRCSCCRASGRRRRSACSIAWPKPPIRSRRCRDLPPPPRAGEDWPAFVATIDGPARSADWPAELERARLLVRAASRAHPRGCRGPPRRPDPARADRQRLSVARALPDRADARSARRDQRPGRRAAARRGLSDPLDHPFGQGPGMEIGVRAQRRRRLHAVRPRRRHDAPRSRRSAACSTSR